jgi:hypothetical protein
MTRVMSEKTMVRVLVSCAALVFLLVVASFVSYEHFLLNPSAQGKCGGQRLGDPDPPLLHIAHFRGRVVGKNLFLWQYRWLRRRFSAVGTVVSLNRDLPPTMYQGNVVRRNVRIGEVVIDKSGHFDFGELIPAQYDISVDYPGQDAVGFGFIIDHSAQNKDVVIDASPAYYCSCCGWTLEPRW